jgi:hypothetical protein
MVGIVSFDLELCVVCNIVILQQDCYMNNLIFVLVIDVIHDRLPINWLLWIVDNWFKLERTL